MRAMRRPRLRFGFGVLGGGGDRRGRGRRTRWWTSGWRPAPGRADGWRWCRCARRRGGTRLAAHVLGADHDVAALRAFRRRRFGSGRRRRDLRLRRLDPRRRIGAGSCPTRPAHLPSTGRRRRSIGRRRSRGTPRDEMAIGDALDVEREPGRGDLLAYLVDLIRGAKRRAEVSGQHRRRVGPCTGRP